MIVENAYGFYGRHVLPLHNLGLVNVIGRNLETKNESSSGSGKTRWWRLFRYLYWGREALDGVTEKKADMAVFGPNFRIEGAFIDHQGDTYVVRETRKHTASKTDGLALFKCPDGIQGKARIQIGAENDPNLLRKHIQSLLNLTHKEACGTVIWPQNFGHALIKGSPTDRAQWLSDLNGLTVYDDVHAELTALLKNAKAEANSLLEYRGEYNAVQADMAAITAAGNIEAVKVEGRTLQAEIKEIDEQIREVGVAYQEALRQVDSITKLVSAVSGITAYNLSPSERDLAMSGMLVRNFEDNASQVRLELDNLKRTRTSVERLHELQVTLASVNIPENLELLKQEHSDLVSVVPQMRHNGGLSAESSEDVNLSQMNLQQDIQDLENLLGFKLEVATAQEKIEELESERLDVEARFREKENSLSQVEEALELDQGCNCPRCLQPVTNRDILTDYATQLRGEIEALTRDQEELANRTGDVLRGRDLLVEVKHGVARLESAKIAEAARAELVIAQARLQQIVPILQAAAANSKLLAERDMLAADPNLQQVQDFESKIAELEQAVQQHQGLRDMYYEAQSAFDNAFAVASGLGIENPFDVDFTTQLQDAEHTRDGHSGWLLEAQECQRTNSSRLEILRNTIRSFNSKATHLADLQAKIDRLDKLEDEILILNSCLKAYGKTGMKVERLQKIMQDISKLLPMWTRVLFTEPYFAVKVDPDKSGTRLALYVTKKFTMPDGKVIVRWVDASALSGGEESRFAVCIMLTLAELVAPEKRTNLLVLDEPDRAYDTYGQQLLANLLIPLMRKKKPSMFVITHQLHLNPQHVDAEFIVTKQKTGLTDVKLVKTQQR
jgi:DNA repair exonuclease SbcCD ATPase subunit